MKTPTKSALMASLLAIVLLACASEPSDPEFPSFACTDVDGQCTASEDEICPAGWEPYDDDDFLDCFGHCCVEAKTSACSEAEEMNCLPDRCEYPWKEVEGNMPCEKGRVCCYWYEE